ncbi:iron efflux ABC transporter ATP-binding subunit FetA [Nissabacter archeti]|uniref:iron efflux ABC transporter ATP-binding subunit FetA n=1 Tax=Nissabacter archeti TaxID=1917880 RepID=UPI0009348AB6|nr:ATP-binding cassette domain-containing protein [Nissabacter archeti]
MAVPPALLQLIDVSYRLNDRPLLQALSFSLAPGEWVMLRGPSGSGKSTLLKLMAALLTPDSGRILFNGQDIAAREPAAYRQQVSYGFQSPHLFGDTVRDNLAFPYLIRGLPVDEERIRAGLAGVALPETMLAKPVSALSGGEKQRVALLRNLQCMPQVLLLDEVTSALDDKNKQRVGTFLRRETRQHVTAVVWISHDRQEARHADRVLWLEHQRLTAGEAP